MAPLLTVRDLSKTFHPPGTLRASRAPSVPAVSEVNLTVNASETVAVVGESGAGKSTLARLVLRLIEPDAGEVWFEGEDLRAMGRRRLRHARGRMQMIFQDPYSSLDPTWTVGSSISEPLRVHRRMSSGERQRRTQELLEVVGLDQKMAQRNPAEFSGGQLQRLAIARAMSVEPTLIVCDEPVTALDVSLRGQILNLLAALQAETGVAYLFISHDLGVVRRFAHRVAVMYAGAIVEVGTPDAIFGSPRHPYTAALLRSIPTPDPRQRRLVAGASPELAVPGRGGGCAYRTRCPHAMPVCESDTPTLDLDEHGHGVACHLAPAGGSNAARGG